MDQLKQVPMGTLVIIVGAISVIGWIALDGTVPLVISIIAGTLIAVRASLDAQEEDS